MDSKPITSELLKTILSKEHYILFLKYFFQVQAPVYVPVMPTAVILEPTVGHVAPMLKDSVTLNEKEIVERRYDLVELHDTFIKEVTPETKKEKLSELRNAYMQYEKLHANLKPKKFVVMELEVENGFVKTGPFVWENVNSGKWVSEHQLCQVKSTEVGTTGFRGLRPIESYGNPTSFALGVSAPGKIQYTTCVPSSYLSDQQHIAKVMSACSQDLELYFVQYNILVFTLRLIMDALLDLPHRHNLSEIKDLYDTALIYRNYHSQMETLNILTTLNVTKVSPSLSYYMTTILNPLLTLCGIWAPLWQRDFTNSQELEQTLLRIYGLASKFPKTFDPISIRGFKYTLVPRMNLPQALMYLIQAYILQTCPPNLVTLAKKQHPATAEYMNLDKKYVYAAYSMAQCIRVWSKYSEEEGEPPSLTLSTLSFLFDTTLARKWTNTSVAEKTTSAILTPFVENFKAIYANMTSDIYNIYRQNIDAKALEKTPADLLIPLVVEESVVVDELTENMAIFKAQLQKSFASWDPEPPEPLKRELLKTISVYYQ